MEVADLFTLVGLYVEFFAIRSPLLCLDFGGSGNYASTLYIAAVKANAVEKVDSEPAPFVVSVKSSAITSQFIKDISVKKGVRVKTILDISSQAKFSDVTKSFLVLLAENGRLKNVGIIAKRFAELAMAYKGEVKAIVTTVLVDPEPAQFVESVKSSAITSQFIKDSKMKLQLGSKFFHRQFWSDCSGRLYDDDLLDVDKLHAEVDWRHEETMTKIDDQGLCWAHIATAAVESAINIYGGELQKPSSQELIECDSENDECNDGIANKAFEYICKNGLHKYDGYLSKKGPKTYIVGHKEIPFKNDRDDENRLRHPVSRLPVTVSIVVRDEFCSYKGSHCVFRTEIEF
ncbi:Cysteine proteinases superfamily protein [Trifolium repens]|nr:Cysteine proteinases superfamily protein [Trifolium repens]